MRCRRHREIEQQIDAKSRLRVTKVDTRGPVQTNATDRYTTFGDGGGHFSDVIEAGDQLEPVFVHDIDEGFEALARMGDDEVEVSCDPLRFWCTGDNAPGVPDLYMLTCHHNYDRLPT
jgi:hypothetical protein